MADKWYIEIIKNSKCRNLLDYDTQGIISWVNELLDSPPDQYDEDWFVDTLDNIVHVQEELYGIDFYYFSKNQALTVAAKIIVIFNF